MLKSHENETEQLKNVVPRRKVRKQTKFQMKNSAPGKKKKNESAGIYKKKKKKKKKKKECHKV